MSAELAKESRAKMRQKAEDMVRADPHQKVDCSDWTPPEPLHTEAKTGESPISRLDYKKAYKRGGKVEGEMGAKRADRMPRKSGGRALTANTLINRDVKEANEERPGYHHDGGYKRGGHVDAKQDRALVREMVEKKAIKPKERGFGGALGILPDLMSPQDKDKTAKKSGGSVSMAEMNGTRPTGGRIARATGGKAGKGKMNVNIVIQTGPKPDDMAGGPAPMLNAPVRPPMPVAAPPPQMPPQMAGPPPGMVPPPMGRKAGGRVDKYTDMEAGSGSGLGRLEKIKEYGKNARR